MSLSAKYLPRATPFDPAEDPPGSVDPLGTLGPAERMAEVLFPGFTARMWRPRLLTFAALASLVAEGVRKKGIGREDSGLAARLGFERLLVSAVMRRHYRKPENWERATRRLPGSSLARRALLSGDTPLGRHNFLKGQAVNGPFGVLARLARHLGVVDEDDRLGRSGEELLLAWSADEQLPGLLEEGNTGSPGSRWLNRFIQETVAHVTKGGWRTSGWSGWRDLAERLRPDNVGKTERRVLCRLLNGDSIRARCIGLLREPGTVSVFRAAGHGGRGEQDRQVLVNAILPALLPNERGEDRVIDFTVRLADAYEQVADLLETALYGLLWGLTRRGGQARPEELQSDKLLNPVFGAVCRQLPGAARKLRDLVERIPGLPEVSDRNPIEPLDSIAFQALATAENPASLVETVITRHRDIQNSKGKGMWVEPGDRWTLMPGFGLASDEPPRPEMRFLHPFRVPNAYSFLGDLGLTRVGVPDGEA